MKRFVTSALVAVTVGTVLANVADAQRPVKKIGKARIEYIQCAANGLNLDANPRKAGEVYLWEPNGGSPQKWYLRFAGRGEYYIESASNGLLLSLTHAKEVVLMPNYGGRFRQTWTLTPVPGEKGSLGSGLYYIECPGARLQLNPATKGNGAKLILGGYTGSHVQRWRLLPAGSPPNVH